VIGFYTPKVISNFYSALNNESHFNHQLLLLASLITIEYLNRLFFSLSTHRYIQLLLLETRKQSFSLWLKASFKSKSRKHDEYPLGEVLARIMNDTDALREVVSSGSFAIFIDIVFILSCLISFLQLNSTTGLALFFAEIGACVLLIKGTKVMSNVFMEVRRVTGMMARVVTDLTSGLHELFYSPNNHYASKRGEKIFEDFLDKQLKANIWDAGYYSAAESLYPFLVALVMLLVPFSQIVEVAILAALLDLIHKSITPIKDVASNMSVLSRAKPGVERIHQFNESFDRNEFIAENYTELDADRMSFSLENFSYYEGFNLKDINFELKRGEILGVLGESGCGKSTLLKLLSGQYQTFNGLISIDDKNIDPSNEPELRKFSSYVSLVSQDSHVFTESLKFNITLGSEANFDDFWILATRYVPYLLKWNISPNDKIDSRKLSLGQKQLISGLRALYLKKPIILMDELSSGLDSELESALKDLLNFFQSRTMTIIVTHRLETILNSQKLLILDSGRMLGFGSYHSLKDIDQFKEFVRHL
jgi:ATP-binding cassette subfamily B protein